MLFKEINSTKISDKIIRHLLKDKILNEYNKSPLRIIEEMNINDKNTRVDLAVVNGILHGYEIKSDLDTLSRLPKQVKDYDKVFDKITLVVGKKHLLEAFKLIPEWWGVVVVKDTKGGIVLNEIRKASQNHNQDKFILTDLLWKNEALEILKSIGKEKGFKSKNKKLIQNQLSENMEIKELKSNIRNIFLYSRKDWRVETSQVLCAD